MVLEGELAEAEILALGGCEASAAALGRLFLTHMYLIRRFGGRD